MTKLDEQIEIPLSKLKIALMLIGSVIIFALGFWMVLHVPSLNTRGFKRYFLGNPMFFLIVGIALGLFSGLLITILVRKLLDKKPGLIINKHGITDNSSGLSGGLILWSEIEKIIVVTANRQKFIMFILSNPQDYLSKVKNIYKRKGMQLNYKIYNAPIGISANSLQISSDKLYKLLLNKMEEYKYK